MDLYERGREARRRDGKRNRMALLAAANEEFAEHGLDVALERIAKRAGLGVATLYRHFPTRAALIHALEQQTAQLMRDTFQRAMDEPDPWQGAVVLYEWVFVRSVQRRSALDAPFTPLPQWGQPADQADGLPPPERLRLGTEILERAQRSGQVRADITYADTLLLAMAFGEIFRYSERIAPGSWRRFFRMFLDLLRPEAAHDLEAPSLSNEQFMRLLIDRARDRGYTTDDPYAHIAPYLPPPAPESAEQQDHTQPP